MQETLVKKLEDSRLLNNHSKCKQNDKDVIIGMKILQKLLIVLSFSVILAYGKTVNGVGTIEE